jgi:hypothetical protein
MTGSRSRLGDLLLSAGGISMVPDSRFWPVMLLAVLIAGCGGGGSGPGVANETALNGAPQIAAIPDQVNSAETYETRVRPGILDPDGDPVSITIGIDNGAVGAAYWDAGRAEIVLEPRGRGRAKVAVSATDGEAVTNAEFYFDVGLVSRRFELQALTDGSEAISIANRGVRPVEFELTHNGFRTFDSIEEIVAHVRDLPAEFPGEPFEMKLWRFLRDNVYHDVYVDPAPWRMSPTVLLNSFGFGLCSSVSAAYRALAAAAGYEARVWALSGHVVPEIRVAGRWQVFDPDLAVFYRLAVLRALRSFRTILRWSTRPRIRCSRFPVFLAIRSK